MGGSEPPVAENLLGPAAVRCFGAMGRLSKKAKELGIRKCVRFQVVPPRHTGKGIRQRHADPHLRVFYALPESTQRHDLAHVRLPCVPKEWEKALAACKATLVALSVSHKEQLIALGLISQKLMTLWEQATAAAKAAEKVVPVPKGSVPRASRRAGPKKRAHR